MSDYDWSYKTSIEGQSEPTAEEWLRATWEEGPRFLQILLPLAWKYGLGLRLGAMSDRERILGWHIADSRSSVVRVDADSRLMRAENIITIDGGQLFWRTVVQHRNAVGRLMWVPAKIVHQWLVPRSLKRAIQLDAARETIRSGGDA